MEFASNSSRLADMIADSHERAERYLITIHQQQLYNECAEQLRSRLDSDGGNRAAVRFIPAMRIISCPIAHVHQLDPLRPDVSVEPDNRVYVDTKFYLPATEKPALSFNPGQRIPWGVAAIHAPALWHKSKGARIRIGVVDTGADYSHPDIRSSLRKGINLINRLASAADDNGHGTHIAGTIAASSTTGIHGVAPRALLYPVKAFDKEGSAYVSDIILAIHWCISQRMHIINMSFGMSDYSPALCQAVKSADKRGIVIVASSGNNGKPSTVDYPARLPQTIGVGAVNKQGRIAAFSNRGKEVDICAPGESIYSAWPGHRYNELSGTSMATAHVSGAIALLMSAKPRAGISRLRTALITSSTRCSNTRQAGTVGRLHALKAWKQLCGLRPNRPKPTSKAKSNKASNTATTPAAPRSYKTSRSSSTSSPIRPIARKKQTKKPQQSSKSKR